jgi:hypothetical protein
MTPESSAILRLMVEAEDIAEKAVQMCDWCSRRGHSVQDCIHYAHYLKMHQRRSRVREFLRVLAVLALGFLAGAVWERMIK